MTEAARSLIDIHQEIQGRGAMFEQLQNCDKPSPETLKTEQKNM